MKTIIVQCIVIYALGSVRGNSEVLESHHLYSCCNSTIWFNPRCEKTWTISGKPIAHSTSNGCLPPCVKIAPGLMTLDGCPAVNATVVCTDDMNETVETIIYYDGQACPESLAGGSQVAAGSVGLLLTVVIGGLIVMMCSII